MADNRPKKITMTTPRGTFVYPKLNEPDLGTKDYPKDPPGEFSVKLRLPADCPKTKALIAKLKPFHEGAVSAAHAAFEKLDKQARVKLEKKGGVTVNDLYTTIYDKETEEPTGELEFKFSMKAGGTIKKGPKMGQEWISRPAAFDAKGKPIPLFDKTPDKNPIKTAPKIYGGTVGIVSFEFTEGGYFIAGTGACGLSLRLAGVQIIELVSGGQKTASALGFTAQDDGFDVSETEAAATPAEADEFEQDADAAAPAGGDDNPDF